MRIELIPINKGQLTGKGGLEQEPVAALERGDAISACAIHQNGDALVFRTQDGKIFSAKLCDPSLVMPGDQVEFMVTGISAERVVLHLMSIDLAAQRRLPAVEEDLAVNGIKIDATAAEVIKLLQSMDRTTSPETIQKAVALIKEQGLDVREAAFFVANRKEASEAQVNVLRSFEGGENLGSTLCQIAAALEDTNGNPSAWRFVTDDEVAENKGTAAPRVGTSTNARASDTGTKVNFSISLSADSFVGETQTDPKGERSVQVNLTDGLEKSIETTVQTPRQAVHPTQSAQLENGEPVPLPVGTAQYEGEFPETSQLQTDIAKDDRSAAGIRIRSLAPERSDSAPGGMKNANAMVFEEGSQQIITDQQQTDSQMQADFPKPKALKGLAEKLLSVFAELERSVSGASIKKNVAEAKNQLVTLARMTEGADSKEAETLAPKLTRAAAQGTLFQNLDKIVFIQIPVHLKQYDTAELYVYKRSKRSESLDAENTSMLIGLTTENLGRIETLIRVERKNLLLSFYVENPELSAEVEDKMDELVVALNDIGFCVTGAKVDLLKERTTPQTAEKTLAAAIKKTGVGFDCRI